VVREFATFPCFPVDDDPVSRLQALTQSLEGSLEEVVLRPEALYKGDNLRVMAVAMGHDPGGVASGAVIGAHGSFWGTACFDVVLNKLSLSFNMITWWICQSGVFLLSKKFNPLQNFLSILFPGAPCFQALGLN